ncbi:ATP-binding protein [Roseivivax sp. CAU 1761]
MVRFREQARTLRALVALVAAAALGATLYSHEQKRAADREQALFNVSALSWKVSELIVETQRVALAFAGPPGSAPPARDLPLRFDLLWSRHDVAMTSAAAGIPAMRAVLDRYADFLAEREAALLVPGGPDPQVAAGLRAELDGLARDMRVTWIDVFSARQVADRPQELQIGAPDPAGETRLIALLIGAVILYVLGEMFLSGRAQNRERRLREEAARANAVKSQFLANVSHEIRTPLNGILGMASELGRGRLDGGQRECVTVIETSGELLLSTINDVLDLSKIEAGQLEIVAAPFDPRAELAAARALYAGLARDKGLTLAVAVDPDLPDRLCGDAHRLRQVIHNLLGNAVKFTAQGGITVRMRADRAAGRVEIAVSDTGPGVGAAAREHIFTPFGQADSGTARRHGGTGLGLSISRHLCEAMGGSLVLDAAGGPGATFRVALPLAEAAPATPAAAPAAAQAADLAALDILVVDDSATNRRLLERFLSPAGCRLRFAESGAAALALCAEALPDVVLTDIQMPEMDGVEMTRRLLAGLAGGGIPAPRIVAVTANAMTHQIEEYRAAGIDEVLAKPVRKAAVLASLTGPGAAAGHAA